MRRRNFLALTTLPLAAPATFTLAAQGLENLDLSMIHQIKNEAFNNSKVMDTMFWLCDANGPRLSGSPGYKKAAEWVKKNLTEQGIADVKFEEFDFGRGWQHTKYAGHMIEPAYMEVIGFPMAWTPGTNGPVRGEVVYAPLRTPADLEKWKGKLKDKIVLADAARSLELPLTSDGHRYTADELSKLADAPEPGANPFGRAGGPPAAAPGAPPMTREQMMAFREKITQFLTDEGVAVVVKTSYTGDSGAVFGSNGGPYQKDKPVPPPTVAIAAEHYNRALRLIEKKVPVTMEFDIQAKFFDEPGNAFNVIAEIPGTSRKDEYVMIGAHLDSWQGGTGATDNAAGSAVMLEAMRILKALNVRTQRSIRLGLWCGEEEGLIGSRAYVKSHLADPADMKTKPEHAKMTAYFNVDNGSGKIRGIYTQGNEMVRKMFSQWLEPFVDMGVSTVTNRNTGGTDHQSFDAVGIPAFQFIQDPLDYSTRTHHSNMDTIDRVQKGDLMQMAAVVASFAYHAATRDPQVPRKPLPKPTPQQGPGGTGGPPSPSSAGGNQE